MLRSVTLLRVFLSIMAIQGFIFRKNRKKSIILHLPSFRASAIILVMEFKNYISKIDAGRLMLSVSGVVTGSMLAAADFHVNWLAALFLIASVLMFQLFPIIIPGVACALAAVYFSYGTLFLLDAFIMMLLGYLAYRSVRSHASQAGLFRNGPVFTLSTLFIYGVMPLYGAYYLCTHSFGSWLLFLPSLAIGSFCLAARNSAYLSDSRTRIFHVFWIAAGWIFMTVYGCMRIFDVWHFLYLLALPLFIWLLIRMWKTGGELDGYGMKLSALTLVFAALSGFGFMIYLF